MLNYLVTSRTRRTLLDLLWRQERSGTVAELARLAEVAFAGAHRELQAMEEAGLAKRFEGQLFRANREHPMARTLTALLAGTVEQTRNNAYVSKANRVREELAALGAPLAVRDTRNPDRSPEEVLVDGVRLARSDASVARALPVVLAHRNYDLSALLHVARKANEKHSLGFFLELAGQLNADTDLVDAAASLKDRRRTRSRPFFPLRSDLEHALAEKRTPELARRWGWLMNMGLDSFENTFAKHRTHATP